MQNDRQVENEIHSRLKAFSEAYRTHNVEAVTRLFVPTDRVVLSGSREHDFAIGIQNVENALRRIFSQEGSLDWQLEWGEINWKGPMAWTTTITKAKNVQGPDLKGRFSAVLERKEKGWFFLQVHFSVAAKT